MQWCNTFKFCQVIQLFAACRKIHCIHFLPHLSTGIDAQPFQAWPRGGPFWLLYLSWFVILMQFKVTRKWKADLGFYIPASRRTTVPRDCAKQSMSDRWSGYYSAIHGRLAWQSFVGKSIAQRSQFISEQWQLVVGAGASYFFVVKRHSIKESTPAERLVSIEPGLQPIPSDRAHRR